MSIAREDITGLVLAGGRGSRMGGVDKGLQDHRGVPLALNAVRRLAPQVGPLMINANRNLEAYEAMGVPVWRDRTPDYAGPLAGCLTGLEHCGTPFLVTVPCDTPDFPQDLVARLSSALFDADAPLAMAATRSAEGLQLQPVFCLLRSTLLDSLAQFIRSGQRKVERWTAQHRCATVAFDDTAAFRNANTQAELQQLRDDAV